MDRAGFKEVRFFKGVEVEHNNAYGVSTLFVVGLQLIADIESYELDVPDHIYFGANDSFHPSSDSEVKEWVDMISYFIEQGHVCTLDIPCQHASTISGTSLVQFDLFQPIIKVPIPDLKSWSKHTHLKIDDVDFNATNEGVWVHPLSSFLTPEAFTGWNEYDGDCP